MAENIPLLECRNISVYRGDNLVLRDFNLTLSPGEHTVILGPNGAGKTTFLRTIARDFYPVYDPESRIRLFGEERWNLFDLRKRIGILSMALENDIPPQMKTLDILLSGYQGVMDVRAFRDFSTAEIAAARKLLEELGLTALAERAFNQMSSGEARRALLGRALINHPELLIFDEPTANLDVKLTFQYLALLRRVLRQNVTVLLVTHLIHEIPPEITRAVLIKNGEIIAQGAKSDLFTAEILSDLFDTPLDLAQHNGYYSVFPQS